MLKQPQHPSIEVLRKKAKLISKNSKVKHTTALEIESKKSGFQNYTHARQFYERAIRVTAFCRYNDRHENDYGLFEYSILLTENQAKILDDNFKKNFRYHRKIREKRIYEVEWNATSKAMAMGFVYHFLRKIQFATITNLKRHDSPWMNGPSRKAIDRFNKAPWSDHDCSWKDKTTGGVIYIQQPYPGKYRLDGLRERQEWAEHNHFSYYEFDWALYGHGTYMIGLSPKRNPLPMDEINGLINNAGKPIGMVKIADDQLNAPYQNDY